MFAVGMLRSYLTQGVYAVGGPFQPFGGAVDIIVVEQKDGSFKSSPWYVKFGDFQGAFKSREKVVNISVNDVPTNFHMSLDFNGEAYFEKEVETPEINSHIEEDSLRPSSSSSDVIASKEAVYVEGNIISKKSSFEASNVFTYDERMNVDSEETRKKADDVAYHDGSENSTPNVFTSDERMDVDSEETQKKADDVAYHDGSENSIPNGHTDYSNGLEYSLSYNASIITENKEVYNSSNVADISFSGNSLSLLEPQKTEDATGLGIESICTHNDGNIKIDLVGSTCYVNTMDIQADMSNLKYATHSELKIEATDNDGGDSMKLANDTMIIDRGHDTVFVELERQMLELKFKLESAQAETDMGDGISYGFEQIKLDERETCNVENLRTDEFINLKKLKNGYATEASQVTENYAKNSESDSWKVKESVVEINDFEKEETEEREEKEQKFVVSRVPSLSKWNLWPLSFRGSRTEKSCSNVSNHALLATTSMRAPTEDSLQKNGYYKWSKKNKIRTYVPTSSQLASLKLNDGPNKVTFVFTSVLGKTEVESRIYLWKWNTRIVISDVDGTITKSDVLGQVMPLIGRDWSQCGVTRLFSAIKDNGFEVLFLSARAITQAYLTRKFLLNLKQDGEALPEGPVFISPDGLLPSLYREVIRRAPHEFKISCLEAIRDLFPRDVNPFYAGFGNRITDEISYLKVGIPKGKIFIINPKGEVVVNNRVDCKSYTSLHALVDDMFPPFSSHEQEEFNSWNYWKVPFPDIDDEISGEKSKNSKKARK